MHKIPCYLDQNLVLHVMPKDTTDCVLAKYFAKELATHGLALIDVEVTTDMYKKMKAEKYAEDSKD